MSPGGQLTWGARAGAWRAGLSLRPPPRPSHARKGGVRHVKGALRNPLLFGKWVVACVTSREPRRRRAHAPRRAAIGQLASGSALRSALPLTWHSVLAARGHCCAHANARIARARPERRVRAAPWPATQYTVYVHDALAAARALIDALGTICNPPPPGQPRHLVLWCSQCHLAIHCHSYTFWCPPF